MIVFFLFFHLFLLFSLRPAGAPQGRLTSRRKKELERKKKHRLFHFVDRMKEGVIVRRHLAHHTCDQVVLQSTVSLVLLTCFLRNKQTWGRGGAGEGVRAGGDKTNEQPDMRHALLESRQDNTKAVF